MPTDPLLGDVSLGGPSEPQPASPYRALGQRSLWLLSIFAPAAWVIGLAAARLAAGPPDYNIDVSLPNPVALLGMTALAMLPVLICLVTVGAVLQHQRLAVSLPRGAAQLGVLYLSVMALLQWDAPPLWIMPWAVALGLVVFVAPPLGVSFVLRWFRWRLVRRRGAEAVPPLAPRYQFRLADLFAWVTLAAVFLGLGTAVLSRCTKEPEGWEGLGPAVIVMISIILCGPTGILSVVFAWLVLAEGRQRSRAIAAVCLAIAWIGSIV